MIKVNEFDEGAMDVEFGDKSLFPPPGEYDEGQEFVYLYCPLCDGTALPNIGVSKLLAASIPQTGTVDAIMTVQNKSFEVLHGPFSLVLSGAAAGVTVDDVTAQGSLCGPYVQVPLVEKLLPDQYALVPIKLRVTDGIYPSGITWTVTSGQPQ